MSDLSAASEFHSELSVCVCLGWVGVFLLPASFLCNPRTGNMPTGSFITLLPNNALFLIFLHVQGEKIERSQPLPAMVMMLSTLLHSCQQFWSPPLSLYSRGRSYTKKTETIPSVKPELKGGLGRWKSDRTLVSLIPYRV